MKRVFSIILALAILTGCATAIVHAQTASDGTTTDNSIDLTMTTVPENPEPLQSVTVSVQSFSTDLNQATLTWTYNGQIIATGTGRTQVTITAPASGDDGNIGVTASGGSFSATSSNLILRPAAVDLLWEGIDSYTPPFYKGRALPSTGGIIRVTAVPSISAPKQLSFSWTENGDAQQESSGFNKSSFMFRNDVLTPTETIGVSEDDGAFSGTSSVVINPGDPSLIAYLNTNGYIDYTNGATDTLNTTDTGANIHFEPYYFSVPNTIGKDLTFTYTESDGTSLPSGTSKNELPLARPDGGGQSQFNVAVSTIAYSLQNLSRVFSINFN